MPLDPRKLRPVQLARLLNSTRLGEVTNERQIRRHQTRAGLQVGDNARIDLFRYVAWLVSLRHLNPPAPPAEPDYAAVKERARQRSAAISAAGRDLGPLPEVVDLPRKERACRDFRFFCESYFPHTFTLPWSPDHLKVIAKVEEAVLAGGLFALAMPRASGKTSLVETACLWAVLIGAREFVCLIGSDEGHAMLMLDSIQTELECNDLLYGDFREICHPLRALERVNQRRLIFEGKTLRMEVTAKQLVLPDMPGSPAAGAIINATGITGRIRGMKFKRPDGKAVRPSLVVIDDPQTDESANSPSQCLRRERTLAGAVLGLAGPGQKIAGIMPCTVIRPGDMADRILDRVKHPQWQGERTKMVYAWPKDEALWGKYAELRGEGLRAGRGLTDATEFYREHLAAMDEGAVVAWPERFNHDELSAIQHAMNLRLQDEAAFFAEYQNDPLPDETANSDDLTADQIASKTNGRGRGEASIACNHLSMFIDVQASLLYYAVVGWQDDFTGFVLDYGTYPDQRRSHFTLREAKPTLADAAAGAGLEGAIYAGLTALTNSLLAREWPRDDGAGLRVARCLVDANWGQSTDIVYQFCRESPHAAVLLPSHGKFVGASSVPFSEYRKRPGDQIGHHWRIPNVRGKRAVRYVLFDTNYWKSFVYARLAVAHGDPGGMSLFGRQASTHRLFAEHLTAEYRVRTEGRGRTVDEWKGRPAKPDNHWFDGLVGCAVAASIQGVCLLGAPKFSQPKRQRVRFSEHRNNLQSRRQI